MRTLAIAASLSIALLAGCGDSDSAVEDDTQFFRDGVARACVDTKRGDLSDCHEIVDSMIAPSALPADADSDELFSLGYYQACTYLFPGCDPAKVEQERKQGLAAYAPD